MRFLARGKVDCFALDPLDLESSLHTGEIWRTGPKWAQEMVTRCERPSGWSLSFPRYQGGALLSLFVGFLCIVASAKVTPTNIARVVTEEDYRTRLVEEVRGEPMSIASKLRGKEGMRQVVITFWS